MFVLHSELLQTNLTADSILSNHQAYDTRTLQYNKMSQCRYVITLRNIKAALYQEQYVPSFSQRSGLYKKFFQFMVL